MSPWSTNDPRCLVETDERRRWLESPRGRRRLQHWAAIHAPLRGWTVPELLSPVGSPRADAMQAALVSLSQDGDGHAALLLLTQLKPGLQRLCRWVAASGAWPTLDSVSEVRATFFETLYRHRLDRRPDKIAANLVLDTRQRLQRAMPGGRTADRPGKQPGPEPFDPAGGPFDPADDLSAITTLRATIERLPGSGRSRQLTADLAYRAWILDQPHAAIADELGIDRRTVAVRLHRLRSTIDKVELQC